MVEAVHGEPADVVVVQRPAARGEETQKHKALKQAFESSSGIFWYFSLLA